MTGRRVSQNPDGHVPAEVESVEEMPSLLDYVIEHGTPVPDREGEVARLRAALAATLPVLQYVSYGRRYVDVQPYPDATARKLLGEICCCPQGPSFEGPVRECLLHGDGSVKT